MRRPIPCLSLCVLRTEPKSKRETKVLRLRRQSPTNKSRSETWFSFRYYVRLCPINFPYKTNLGHCIYEKVICKTAARSVDFLSPSPQHGIDGHGARSVQGCRLVTLLR